MVSTIERTIKMPLTVITLKNVPPSLRGDLTKWMQEIATGVFIGNFNVRVREQLWSRVKDSVGNGEATLSFAHRNELGYHFDTINAQRTVIDYDGIPLVLLPNSGSNESENPKLGYSDAARFRRIKKFSSSKNAKKHSRNYVVLDIETDGLDENKNSIIEIGAIKVCESELEKFHYFIKYDKILPKEIKQLTGISNEMLQKEGKDIEIVLQELLDFIGDLDIVGYGIQFDLSFINKKMLELSLPLITNRTHDLMRFVKSEKKFLENYKLQTALKNYGIGEKVPHRAILDAELIYKLSTKLTNFWESINQK